MDINRRKSNRVNAIKWSTMRLQWEGKLGAAHAFKGIHDYEEWAMRQSPPNPNEGWMQAFEEMKDLEGFLRGEEGVEEDWMTPQEFYSTGAPKNEKEKLFAQAKVLRQQINDAIDRDDFEAAAILQKTMDVIKIKYDKL